MDTGNKLNNYLKIKGMTNSMFRPQKTIKELYNTIAFPGVTG